MLAVAAAAMPVIPSMRIRRKESSRSCLEGDLGRAGVEAAWVAAQESASQAVVVQVAVALVSMQSTCPLCTQCSFRNANFGDAVQ